jgi:hypothetical protein
MTAANSSLQALTWSVPTFQVATPAAGAADGDAASDGNLTFNDILDIVNPLQHLPVVSTLYRAVTGDHIKTFPKIAGDALYGGWMGFAGSVADTIFEKVTGKSFGDTALAFVEKQVGLSPDDQPTGVADAAPATPVEADSAPVKPVQVAALPPIDTTATSVASNAPALPAPASLDSIAVPGQSALLSALSRGGVEPDTARRAVDAYRRSVAVAAAPAPALRTAILQ